MAQLVTSLVIYRLDYCNSVLAGLPASTLAPLQRVQNAAARLVLNRDRRSHITPALQHWLPVKYRIIFQIATLMHHFLHNRCLSYLIDLIAFNTADSRRRQLRSSQSRAAIVKRTPWHGPNSVNAPSRLVVPTYGTVFLQQSATLTVIQHLDELWRHIYSSVLLLYNFLSFCVHYWLL